MTKRRSPRLATPFGAFLAVFALAGAALAQDAAPQSTPPSQSAMQCLNAGQSYKTGDYACIAACHGQRRLARCDAGEAAARWTYISESCPSAMLNPPWPDSWSEVPAALAMSPIPVTVNRSVAAPDVGSTSRGSADGRRPRRLAVAFGRRGRPVPRGRHRRTCASGGRGRLPRPAAISPARRGQVARGRHR